MKTCPKCNISKPCEHFYLKASWCKICLLSYQKIRWKSRKKKAVEILGGKCARCGYNRNLSALDFHHLEPEKKEFNWNRASKQPWPIVIKELEKCICLCKNCHAEIHNPSLNYDEVSSDAANIQLVQPKMLSSGKCPVCNADVYGTIYCSRKCMGLSQRKTVRPTKKLLKKLLLTTSYRALGRMYGVCDNTIRKWLT